MRKDLVDSALAQMGAADPYGRFAFRENYADGAVTLTLGRARGSNVVFGCGWNAYIGPGSPSIPDIDDQNPFGAALASILAAAHVFASNLTDLKRPFTFNAYDWRDEASDAPFDGTPSFGTGWLVGCGSVGTAIAYFLTMAGCRPTWTLADGDDVNVHNLDRSPIFLASDVGRRKVEATYDFLTASGVPFVDRFPYHLHDTHLLQQRQNGAPDVIFAAANAHDVRYILESNLPPLQVYGTTGKNWQASLIRHIPIIDACSCCLFPPLVPMEPDTCATDAMLPRATQDQVDAALPFLSFAAGMMAAAEMCKLGRPAYTPPLPNRVTLYTHGGDFRLLHSTVPPRPNCVCANRTASSHQAMISGTAFADLSSSKR